MGNSVGTNFSDRQRDFFFPRTPDAPARPVARQVNEGTTSLVIPNRRRRRPTLGASPQSVAPGSLFSRPADLNKTLGG